jgi:hypothetical protein
MAKGVPHYFRDGREHKGGVHKMPDGKELPKTVQEKIRKRKKKS